MRLTLRTHFHGEWHHAATLELKDDAAGFQGASIVDYDLERFVVDSMVAMPGMTDEWLAGRNPRKMKSFKIGERLRRARAAAIYACPEALQNSVRASA